MHAQRCLILCDSMDYSPTDSSVHGIFQPRILKLPFPPPGDPLNPEIKPVSLVSPASADGFFTTSATWDAMCLCSFCPTGAVPLHFFLGSQRSPTERKDETLLKGKKKWAPKTM